MIFDFDNCFFNYDVSDFNYGVVFSCDSNYFKRFFQISIDSLRLKSKKFLAFYLVINPDNEVMEIIRQNSKRNDVCFLIFEKDVLMGGDKANYAIARFFAAKFFLAEFGKPVFIFDIDTYFENSINGFFEEGGFNKDKVNLRVSNVLSLPWHKIPAGFVFVPNNKIGENFLVNVCLFLQGVFGKSSYRNLWWADQNALFFVYDSMEKDGFNIISGDFLKSKISYPKMFVNKDNFFVLKK